VWDDELLRQRRMSLKRIVFMYEALLELPVTIQRGDVAAQVRAYADLHQATRIVTSASVSPRFRQIVRALRTTHRVEVMPEPDFVQLPATSDIRRFTRYWRAVAPQLEEMAARNAP
jgi:K+-sensing histidine kinase KdpD